LTLNVAVNTGQRDCAACDKWESCKIPQIFEETSILRSTSRPWNREIVLALTIVTVISTQQRWHSWMMLTQLLQIQHQQLLLLLLLL